MLAEVDRCIVSPLDEDHSALFFYALYLCAEMRSEEAFSRYVAICRLPTLLMNTLIGDILTQNMPENAGTHLCRSVRHFERVGGG